MTEVTEDSIKLWTSLDIKDSCYFVSDESYFHVINIAPLQNITIIDCDHPGVYLRSAFAYIKTEKGYHFFCPPEVDHLHPLQDPKFHMYCKKHGFYSLRIHNKADKSPRYMVVEDDRYEWLGKKWNALVNSVSAL